MDDRLDDTALGLTYGQIRLLPSDPGWPRAFQRLAAELRATLGQVAVAVEHVGSTAVPGLPAKPILDVAIGLAPGADPDRVITALRPLGYQFRGDKGDEGGLLLVLKDRPAHRTAHLHLVHHGDVQWRRYLALRDRLRADRRRGPRTPGSRVAWPGSSPVTAAPTPPPRQPSSWNCCPRTTSQHPRQRRQ
jgi:GrpB-like predicted nucleotidyltransferase (UPF0157 family)